ncbi:hypothetical protein Moror_10862 [Moniliophthora roreri MCA 2997]|uniref:Uncharacterized protein n=1 Tax=Moniliophthora roreri (strain MCA 2997) TaxID=1381753 RepID=V2WM55_MONRO|nr:hypothetical protein Moror_10862 [Moniliophthora roreri MCA 2997]
MNIIGGLRFNTVYSPSMKAVARWPRGAGPLWGWWESNRTGLVEETVLDDGLTRFELVEGDFHLEAWHHSWKFGKGWLSQSSRAFDAVEVAGGKEKFFVVKPPNLKIQSTRRPAASRTLHNDEHPVKEAPPTPIYLFLHPLPMSVSEFMSWMDGHFYFWSFDETGQSQMSEEECERWRLPVLTSQVRETILQTSIMLQSWSTHVYTTLRDWQKARGFDPATSDWARHMRYPEFEILSDSGQSKEVREDQEGKKVSNSWWEAFEGLSPEVINLIVEQLHDYYEGDLASLSLATQARLFTRIYIFNPRKCAQWNQNIKESPHLARYVKEVKFSDHVYPGCLRGPEAETLVSLTNISVSTSIFFRKYLLLRFPESRYKSGFASHLISTNILSKFKSLTSIMFTSSKDQGYPSTRSSDRTCPPSNCWNSYAGPA